jgi:hypothetical protein
MRLMSRTEIDSITNYMIISEVKISHLFDKPMEEAVLKLEKCSFISDKPDIFWENVGWKISSTINEKESAIYIVASDFNIFGVFSSYMTSVYAEGKMELYPSDFSIVNDEIHQRNIDRDKCFKEIYNCKVSKQSQIDKTVKAYAKAAIDLIKK